MNEELNLVEILKNVPSGTKFWSDVYGEICFEGVDEDPNYPLNFESNCYTEYGQLYKGKGQCVLFPSKTQRDWSKFVVEEVFEKDEPVMCSEDGIDWKLRYYNLDNKQINAGGYKSDENTGFHRFGNAIKVSDFDFVNRCKKTK